MKSRSVLVAVLVGGLFLGVYVLNSCAPSEPQPVQTVTIADGEIDPAKWGKGYPSNYDSWLATKEPRPAGKSRYKKGFDGGVTADKLSEFPFMALLFNGWGFGIEYNEPRGHYHMVADQLEIDPSRVKAGGACLTCKTPYASHLKNEMGVDYFKNPYLEVHSKIPKEAQRLGVACNDCHDNKDMTNRIDRWTLRTALKEIGKDPDQLTRQEKRSLVCAQCHVTYVVEKDKAGNSVGVFFPWQGSEPEKISVENIIRNIRSSESNLEWKHAVTGFKMAFIRHPEYEFFTFDSVHSKANVSCADCHMPYTRQGSYKISDHNITSPIKNGMKACQQCHSQTPEWLSSQVFAIQDRTVSMINRAGYATAVAAKLLESAHKAQAGGKMIDRKLYERAKDLYLEAFYRVNFIGAENSVGFHNPSEAGRICSDAVAFAMTSQSLLRQALVQEGVAVPADVNLELNKYVHNRGSKKLPFKSDVEFKDPFGLQDQLTPAYGK
ncbi:MAG: ammonia-forming cytochrome c nitrite reductase subunit c552 [Desulfobacterales bacterium]|nr:ammonia-forming cytochrome c nitrite reductase subunit c552 [Desulfobacterales bacterium]